MAADHRGQLAAAVARGETIVLVREALETRWLVSATGRPAAPAGPQAPSSAPFREALIARLRRWLFSR